MDRLAAAGRVPLTLRVASPQSGDAAQGRAPGCAAHACNAPRYAAGPNCSGSGGKGIGFAAGTAVRATFISMALVA